MMRYKIGRRERNDLLISWLTISVAFAIVLFPSILNVSSIMLSLVISLFAVGTGFILHELAHKFMAIKYGCRAEFFAWKSGLFLAILLPIITFGQFLFAAPGAVYIHGSHINYRQNGIISLAGPAVNTLLAIVFFVLSAFTSGLFSYVLYSAALINAFLGFFNMLPIFVLDGAKIFAWNKSVWLVMIILTAALAFFPEMLMLFL